MPVVSYLGRLEYDADNPIGMGLFLRTDWQILAYCTAAGDFQSKSANYTVLETDWFIAVDCSAATRTMTLDSAPSTGTRHCFYVSAQSGSYKVTVSGNGKNVDGAASIDLTAAGDVVKIVYDGTAWILEQDGRASSYITDHGLLTGLADDDHTQYHTDARAVIWLAAGHETTYNHANYNTAYSWGAVTLSPSGFANRTLSSISFNVSSPDRTFTVAPTGANFDIYSLGVKYTKTSTTKQIDSGANLYYIYFDTTGTIQQSTTAWDIGTGAVPIAMVYWNGTDYRLYDERHGASRWPILHEYLHETRGAAFASGGALTAATNGSTFTVETGEWYDEDYEWQPAQQTTAPIMYRASGVWTWTSAQAPYYHTVGSVPQYDNAGTLTDVPAAKYSMTWFFWSNDTQAPVVMLMGQGQYNTQALAEAVDPSSLTYPPGLAAESRLLYRVVWQRNGAVIAKASTTDYRRQVGAASSYVASDHTGLTNLAWTSSGHTGTASSFAGFDSGATATSYTEANYLLAAGTRALTGNWDAGSYKITAQQLESDVATGTAPLVVASTTAVSNLNADLLDGSHASAFLLVTGATTGATAAIQVFTFGITATIISTLAADQIIRLGDNAGSNKLSINNSSDVTIAYIDSLGTVSGNTLTSTVAIGTAPLSVTSTTACTNLNADLLDGNHAAAFALSGHTHASLHDALTLGTVTDVLSLSTQQLNAVDAGADKGVFWDDSEGKLSYFTLGTSVADILAFSATTIAAVDAGADRIVIWDDSESKLAYVTVAGAGCEAAGAVSSHEGSYTHADIALNTAARHAAVTMTAAVTGVLSLSTQEVSAVDAGADRIVIWDDSESKLAYVTVAGAGCEAAGAVSGHEGSYTHADIALNTAARHAAVTLAATVTDVLSLSTQAIGGVDAGADKIVYWNNTSNTLTYGTVSEVGAAAAVHSHAYLADTGDQCDGQLIIDDTNAEAFLVRKDADGGDVFTVNTNALTVLVNGILYGYDNAQFQSDSASKPQFKFFHHGDTANSAASIYLNRGRTSYASASTVATGDWLGSILFYGHEGTTWKPGARIRALVNGTVATNHVPTDFYFDTDDGSTLNTNLILRNATGNLEVRKDNQYIIWGTGQDAGVYYDGTDFCFNPKLVGTGGFQLLGKVVNYNSIAAVSNGVPAEYATVDLTAQAAAISATTLYTPAASGMFRISIVLQVTRAATTSSVLGGATGVTITYTEPDGSVAQSIKPLLTSEAGAVIVPATGNIGNATTTQSQGSCVIYAKTGVAIQYAIGYTSVGATTMQYSVHLKCEAL